MTFALTEFFARASAGTAVWVVFLLLVIGAACLAIYFLWRQLWVGAVVAAVIAVLLAVFLL